MPEKNIEHFQNIKKLVNPELTVSLVVNRLFISRAHLSFPAHYDDCQVTCLFCKDVSRPPKTEYIQFKGTRPELNTNGVQRVEDYDDMQPDVSTRLRKGDLFSFKNHDGEKVEDVHRVPPTTVNSRVIDMIFFN